MTQPEFSLRSIDVHTIALKASLSVSANAIEAAHARKDITVAITYNVFMIISSKTNPARVPNPGRVEPLFLLDGRGGG
jgi:hypothetical protein